MPQNAPSNFKSSSWSLGFSFLLNKGNLEVLNCIKKILYTLYSIYLSGIVVRKAHFELNHIIFLASILTGTRIISGEYRRCDKDSWQQEAPHGESHGRSGKVDNVGKH